MQKMRVVLIGQAAFGEKVLQALVDRGEEVVAVYAPPDPPGKISTLKALALKLGIPSLQPANMRSPAVYEEYTRLKPDLNVMAFVTAILPANMLSHARLGSIQYHPSLLPKHRGGSAINWPIIFGETITGITIFWPDKGIDTGPILLQKSVEISPDDTLGSLYFNRLFPMGIEAIAESIDLIKNGTAPRIPQVESEATYDPLCTEDRAVIDWRQPAAKVYNLIRGTNPQPGAVTEFQGKRLRIFDSQLLGEKVGGAPGEIMSIDEAGFSVAAADGSIRVKRVQPKGRDKMASPEFAAEVHLKMGDRLGK